MFLMTACRISNLGDTKTSPNTCKPPPKHTRTQNMQSLSKSHQQTDNVTTALRCSKPLLHHFVWFPWLQWFEFYMIYHLFGFNDLSHLYPQPRLALMQLPVPVPIPVPNFSQCQYKCQCHNHVSASASKGHPLPYRIESDRLVFCRSRRRHDKTISDSLWMINDPCQKIKNS